MALASGKYDIKLNTVGYVLVEESYRQRAQQPFNARFSSGDPGYGDLSFWQFLVQEAWDGGIGQLIFQTKNKIAESVGWDLRLGQPRISYGQRTVTYSAGSLTQLKNDTFNEIGKFIRFPGSTKPRLLLIGRNAALANATLNSPTVASADDPSIVQINSKCACIFDRSNPDANGESRFIVCASDNNIGTGQLLVYNTAMTLRQTINFGAITAYTKQIVQVGKDSLALITSQGYFYVFTFDSGAWTGASNPYCNLTIGGGRIDDGFMAHAVALDSNSALYCLTQSVTFPEGTSGHVLTNSQLHVITSTDLLLSTGPRISATHVLDHFCGTGLISLNGTIYILGSMKPKSGSQLPTIIKFPNTIIWQGRNDDLSTDNSIACIHQTNRDTCYFIAKGSLGQYDSIYRLTADGIVIEVASIKRVAPTGNTWEHMALGLQGERFYWYDFTANAIYSTNDVRGALDSSGTYAILETSEFGANTPLINKTLFSVTVELSSALPGSESYTVLVNDVSLGTISASDGTKKEITAGSTEFTSTGFVIKLQVPRATVWTGYLKRITIKYIPTQFKKKAWSFGIRLDRNLKLIDGTRETTLPEALFTSIKTAWTTNTPVTFVDIDGSSYSVLVTDFDQRRGLINRDVNKLESMLFVELLEV